MFPLEELHKMQNEEECEKKINSGNLGKIREEEEWKSERLSGKIMAQEVKESFQFTKPTFPALEELQPQHLSFPLQRLNSLQTL